MVMIQEIGSVGMADKKMPPAPGDITETTSVDVEQTDVDVQMEQFFAELEAEQAEIPEAVQKLGAERVRDFLQGKMTWAEIFDIPSENLQKMAELGFLQFQSGRLEEAERFFKVLTMLNYSNPMFHNILGQVYQKQKKYGEAIVQFSQALDLDKSDGASMVSRAEILIQHGWYINALTDLEAALALPEAAEASWGKRATALKVRAETLKAELGKEKAKTGGKS